MLLTLAAFAAPFPQDQAATPPMGWNSWNCFGTTVTAEGVLAQAQAIADSGLREKGYVYVVIDDGWQGERDATTGALQGNADFADIGSLSDQVRALGLRLGIYSTPWDTSYGGFPGGAEHEAEDAWQWARWRIRYLKYDWNPNDVANVTRMRDALATTGGPLIYALSNTAKRALAPTWAELANQWRTTSDITDTWDSLQSIGFAQSGWEDVSGPGHWNDPDMLILGYVGWGAEQHLTRLTADEQKTHVTLWALLAAPLLMGMDVTRIDAETLALLTNDRVLEVDQDPAGVQAFRAHVDGTAEVWARPLSSGAWAVGVFNRGETEADLPVEWGWLALSGAIPVTDLWDEADLGTQASGVTVTVPAHGARLLQVGEAAPVAPAFVGPLEDTATEGVPFGLTLLTSGARPITLTATLPDGLTLEGNLLTGTLGAGSYDIDLVAENAGGVTADTLHVDVAPAGDTAISLFAASELSLPPGQTGELRWITNGTTTLDPFGAVEASGTIEITPTETTTYTLTTTGDRSETTSVTVEVPTGPVRLGLRTPGRLRPTNDEAEWAGWGLPGDDWTISQAGLSVGGVTTLHGIGTHADSALSYALGGHYARFTAQAGIDDEVNAVGAEVVFSVEADGVEVWSSGAVGASDAPVVVDLDVTGVATLVLRATHAGETIDDDHVDWLDPEVLPAAVADSGDTGDSGDTADSGDTGDGEDTGDDTGDTGDDSTTKDTTGDCGCASGVAPTWGALVLAAFTTRRRIRASDR